MSKVTLSLLKKLFPGTSNSDLNRFVEPFNTILPKYDITTKKRFAAFIANVGIESDHLKALQEYASGTAYEGRKNLGNIRPGDGVRYKGRSVLQTTGRYNYWKVVVAYLRVLTGKNWDSKLAETDFDAYLRSQEYTDLLAEADKYNVNFLANPQLLEEFPHAVEAAGVFVKDKNLNNYADSGNFFAYAGVLNKGSATRQALAYNDRKALYNLAMDKIPEDFELKADNTPDPQPIEPLVPPAPDNGGNVTQNVDVK
jgi:predicted chitinase